MRETGGIAQADLFGTPVMVRRLPDPGALNAALRSVILAHAAADAGVTRSNLGGWHSTYGDLGFCGEAGMTVSRHMADLTQAATARLFRARGAEARPITWSFEAWANVSRQGDGNALHDHPQFTWSGVYYVDTGWTGEGAGVTPLEFVDPMAGRADFFPDLPRPIFSLRPEPGLMVLFPSYLQHSVPPHQGDRPRISIAFNVREAGTGEQRG